jgi:broad specificity phosphatase PhoE
MRHPQTQANIAHVLSGREDVDLTKEGEHQLFRAAKALAAWKPERIWVSPLSRCKAIGEEAASALGIACEVHEDLAEIEFGPAQDLTTAELEKMGYIFPWAIGPDGRSQAPEGAESFEELIARGARLLDSLRPLTGRTACITHGGFTRALLAAVFHTPLDTFWNIHVPNVSSQVLTCDGRDFRLEALGLAPEEVMGRCLDPSLIGVDTTSASELEEGRA